LAGAAEDCAHAGLPASESEAMRVNKRVLGFFIEE
jgi:hypothetical protein